MKSAEELRAMLLAAEPRDGEDLSVGMRRLSDALMQIGREMIARVAEADAIRAGARRSEAHPSDVFGAEETDLLSRTDLRFEGAGEDEAAIARARLAAAAPEMARVLLAVEWQGCQDFVGDGGYRCCPTCRGVAPGEERLTDAVDDVSRGRTVLGHRSDCTLDASLWKAGVR